MNMDSNLKQIRAAYYEASRQWPSKHGPTSSITAFDWGPSGTHGPACRAFALQCSAPLESERALFAGLRGLAARQSDEVGRSLLLLVALSNPGQLTLDSCS